MLGNVVLECSRGWQDLTLAREDKPVSQPVGRCLAFVLLVEKRPEWTNHDAPPQSQRNAEFNPNLYPPKAKSGHWPLGPAKLPPGWPVPEWMGFWTFCSPLNGQEVSLGERKGIVHNSVSNSPNHGFDLVLQLYFQSIPLPL